MYLMLDSHLIVVITQEQTLLLLILYLHIDTVDKALFRVFRYLFHTYPSLGVSLPSGTRLLNSAAKAIVMTHQQEIQTHFQFLNLLLFTFENTMHWSVLIVISVCISTLRWFIFVQVKILKIQIVIYFELPNLYNCKYHCC